MASIEAEIKPTKRQSTMPTQPSPKKQNFFRRHIGHKRRSSSVSFTNSPSPAPQVQSLPQRPSNRADSTHGSHVVSAVQVNGVEKVEEPVESNDVDTSRTPSSETEASDDTLTKTISRGSRGNVRWAEGFEGSNETRPRRPSSGQGRRSSIYLRSADGHHVEGVDAGAGSKARKLSVHIPEQFEVEQCPLDEHFSLFSRMGKKDIGEGGAAVVRLMQSKTAGEGKSKDKVFAVKEFRPWDESEESEIDYQRKIKSEYAIAKSLEHPNIVETYRLCFSDHQTKWYHVMEYCDQGDLNDIINKGFFKREDKDCMFKQLIRGVDYLHSRGIAHRDIKSENLLLTKTGCLKIADFGTSEVFSGKHPGLRKCRRPSLLEEGAEIRLSEPGLVGSRPYMAPELLEHKEPYDPRGLDVWSCAVCYITLVVGGTPWAAATPDVKNYNIYCASWDRWLKQFPDGLIDKERELPDFSKTANFRQLGDAPVKALVFGMLHPDPTKRWTARQALESVTVTEFPCCQQDGYSDDIKTRQRKASHNHLPPKKSKGLGVKAS